MESINTSQKVTVASRQAIGFPEKPSQWRDSSAHYDPSGSLLKILGHPVMESWEEPYMKSLARIATSGGGRLLEVGFGLGISAKFIQAGPISEHVIIEANREVCRQAVRFAQTAAVPTIVHEGFWQDIVPAFASGSFQGILFDTYPMHLGEVHCQHFAFFEQARRLLSQGGVFTYYSDEAEDFSPCHRQALRDAGFSDNCITGEICEVDTPLACEYWKEKTFLSPIIIKK
ncbi:MAG: class I SAM-dependent methyltransferase [Smithellaceae bacterium]